MNGKATSVLRPDGDYRLWEDLDQRRFFGLVALTIGLSQALVAFTLFPDHQLSTFPVAAGGWFLVGVGTNLLRGKEPHHSDWHEDGTNGRIALAVMGCLTVVIVGAAVASVVTG